MIGIDSALAKVNAVRSSQRDRRPSGWGPASAVVAVLIALAPSAALACACGCGIFEVGAGSMRPSEVGGMVSIENDYMDQNRNWSGSSSAPAGDNDDKEIRTNFVTASAQYMFDRSWGAVADVPVWTRRFRTADEATGAVDTYDYTALGDIRLLGVYSGFSPDMSTGVTFGVKLPTGDWKHPHFDRDTQIGSGSTDLLLGGYHQGSLVESGRLDYFVQGLWDRPVAYQDGYRPGQEFDGTFGVYFNGASLSGGKIRVAPIVQLIASARQRDAGSAADSDNTGYERLVLSPGVEFDTDAWKLYGDVRFAVYQHVNGDQVVARSLFQLVLSRSF